MVMLGVQSFSGLAKRRTIGSRGVPDPQELPMGLCGGGDRSWGNGMRSGRNFREHITTATIDHRPFAKGPTVDVGLLSWGDRGHLSRDDRVTVRIDLVPFKETC